MPNCAMSVSIWSGSLRSKKHDKYWNNGDETTTPSDLIPVSTTYRPTNGHNDIKNLYSLLGYRWGEGQSGPTTSATASTTHED